MKLKLKGYFPSKNPNRQGLTFSQPGSDACLENLNLDFAIIEDSASKKLEFLLLELSPENVGVIVLEP